VSAVCASGRSLLLGDAVGADGLALSAALRCDWPEGGLRVFAAGGRGGFLLSRVSLAPCPVAVAWWAGGGPALPLRARLVRRSAALVGAAAGGPRPGSGLVAFFALPDSPGSLRSCRAALAAGLPVVAFPCGFPPSALPLLSVGAWSPLPPGPAWGEAFRWVPAPF
jgi:hypothetical protein